MTYKLAILQGRLMSGLEHDRGFVVHAVPDEGKRIETPGRGVGFRYEYPALCGKKPGRRSVGWGTVEEKDGAEVTCDRCKSKLRRFTVEK